MTNHQLDEEAIFHVARGIPDPETRAKYLEQICAGNQSLRERVEGLLRVYEQQAEFLKSSSEPGPTIDQPQISERPGTTIGRYRLMEQIGEGGMGTVFVAEQERPIRRKVAVKVIKPGMDTKAVVARLERSIRGRMSRDLQSLRKAIEKARLSEADRGQLAAEFKTLAETAQIRDVSRDESFRAVLPIGEDHARLFSIQAELWRGRGLPKLAVAAADRWDPLDPFAAPASSDKPLRVDLMRGKYRAAAFNLANSTGEPIEVRIRFSGLAGGSAPGWITVHQAEWTDTSQLVPVVSALPVAKRDGESWKVSVHFVMLRNAVAAARAAGRSAEAASRAESLLKTGPAHVLEDARPETLRCMSRKTAAGPTRFAWKCLLRLRNSQDRSSSGVGGEN